MQQRSAPSTSEKPSGAPAATALPPTTPAGRPTDSPADSPAGRLADRAARRFGELRLRPWFWPAALTAGYAAELLFRLVLARHLSYPSVHPDEDSYLVLARVLAGRPTTEIPVGVVIPGGYPLLISPALRLADDPVTAYHLIMGINALVSALVFPLAYVALRRLGLRRQLAYVFGAVTALLPPVVFYSQFAMTDALLPALILAWLLCLHGWLDDGPVRRRAWHAAGAGAAAAYAMATHDRGGVVVALTAVVFAGVLLLRWAPWRTTVAGLGALGPGVLGAELLAAWLHTRFSVQNSDVGGFLRQGLTDPEAARRTLTRTAGQLWYFIVCTWGIGGLAVTVCLFAVFSRRFPRPQRITGGALVALLAGTALAAAAALPDDGRIDDWVYARYTSYLVPAAFVAGVAVLARYGRRALGRTAAATAGLTLVLAELVVRSAGAKLRTQSFVLWGLPDVSFLSTDWSRLTMFRATAAALVILGAVVLLRAAGGRPVLWAIGLSLALFAAFATSTITAQVTGPHAKWRKAQATGFTRTAGLKPDDNVVFAWDVEWSLRAAQAFEVYRGRVWYRDPRWQPVPAEATVLVTPLPAPGQRPEEYWPGHPAGWYVEQADTQQNWALWRRH
ncbi:phospholipid carrier-dependent glycosyltransferase [Kitasatospora sp. RG8]|uniref:phospholipid carrier-dependent glycosyltransferase n=1 Tax=Kitasatospora sp. RG8 TaxID=2820815 RepID=UPI001AE09971|nr:phospholipid carrier-dependent glycosyltransferase [Kitasatospora sp. RG8]MBP0451027.1 phospholipid carrier-dependent glycosyltransferase [Kitasatospora sp. RG8]